MQPFPQWLNPVVARSTITTERVASLENALALFRFDACVSRNPGPTHNF